MQLGSGVAVAVAVSYSSNSTPSLGTSICCGWGHWKKKKKAYRVINRHALLQSVVVNDIAPSSNRHSLLSVDVPHEKQGIIHIHAYIHIITSRGVFIHNQGKMYDIWSNAQFKLQTWVTRSNWLVLIFEGEKGSEDYGKVLTSCKSLFSPILIIT